MSKPAPKNPLKRFGKKILGRSNRFDEAGSSRPQISMPILGENSQVERVSFATQAQQQQPVPQQPQIAATDPSASGSGLPPAGLSIRPAQDQRGGETDPVSRWSQSTAEPLVSRWSQSAVAPASQLSSGAPQPGPSTLDTGSRAGGTDPSRQSGNTQGLRTGWYDSSSSSSQPSQPPSGVPLMQADSSKLNTGAGGIDLSQQSGATKGQEMGWYNATSLSSRPPSEVPSMQPGALTAAGGKATMAEASSRLSEAGADVAVSQQPPSHPSGSQQNTRPESQVSQGPPTPQSQYDPFEYDNYLSRPPPGSRPQ
jgi:hypothetical protein